MRLLIQVVILGWLCYWLCGCSSANDPYKEYLLCVNGECELYVDVQELEVCVNEWDSNLYNFETRCYNILDIDNDQK